MKRIVAAVCIDDGGGMLFNNRRQSRDRLLIANLLESAKGKPLYIHPYSALLFDGADVTLSEDPLADCPDGGICFLEKNQLAPHADDIGVLIVYKWNTVYPCDTKLDLDPRRAGFVLREKTDFVGSSHDKITKEVYKK